MKIDISITQHSVKPRKLSWSSLLHGVTQGSRLLHLGLAASSVTEKGKKGATTCMGCFQGPSLKVAYTTSYTFLWSELSYRDSSSWPGMLGNVGFHCSWWDPRANAGQHLCLPQESHLHWNPASAHWLGALQICFSIDNLELMMPTHKTGRMSQICYRIKKCLLIDKFILFGKTVLV